MVSAGIRVSPDTHQSEMPVLIAVSYLPLPMYHDLMLTYHLLILIPRLLMWVIRLVLSTPCQLKPITNL